MSNRHLTGPERILKESGEASGIHFIDPKSPKGRRLLTLQGNNLRTGSEHLLAVDNDTLLCSIERVPTGWLARFGLQEVSQVYDTLVSCKDAIVRRFQSQIEGFTSDRGQFTRPRNRPVLPEDIRYKDLILQILDEYSEYIEYLKDR
jgi:hypothetical protein